MTTAGTLVYVSTGTALGRADWDGMAAGSTLWKLDGACTDADPEVFYPPKGHSATLAKAWCAACPVAERCLEFALAVPPWEDWGVWGGTTEMERRRMRARMG